MMESEVNSEKVSALYVALIVGGLANLFLLLSLVLTWTYWRQVKWYILTLAIANWLELAFRYVVELSWHYTKSWKGGTVFSCKFLMMMEMLGPSLANMAVAALAVHTLLTILMGSQGERLRHGLVLGLFVLLSLPLPLARIPMFTLLTIPFLDDGSVQCATFAFFESQQQLIHYNIGHCVALVFFPLFVVFCCEVVSAVVRRGVRVKGDEHASDTIITDLLAAVMLVCSVPVYTFILVKSDRGYYTPSEHKVYDGLSYLEYCRNIVSALVTAGFAYLYVYRKRGEPSLGPVCPEATSGERQKLVH